MVNRSRTEGQQYCCGLIAAKPAEGDLRSGRNWRDKVRFPRPYQEPRQGQGPDRRVSSRCYVSPSATAAGTSRACARRPRRARPRRPAVPLAARACRCRHAAGPVVTRLCSARLVNRTPARVARRVRGPLAGAGSRCTCRTQAVATSHAVWSWATATAAARSAASAAGSPGGGSAGWPALRRGLRLPMPWRTRRRRHARPAWRPAGDPGTRRHHAGILGPWPCRCPRGRRHR
jgi:hypothetical protein